VTAAHHLFAIFAGDISVVVVVIIAVAVVVDASAPLISSPAVALASSSLPSQSVKIACRQSKVCQVLLGLFLFRLGLPPATPTATPSC
jgi:hypothetical protein